MLWREKTATAKIAYLLQSGMAFVNLYKLDKSFCTKLIAAVTGASVSYSSRSSSARAAAAARRQSQRNKQVIPDKDALLGPPDKSITLKPLLKGDVIPVCIYTSIFLKIVYDLL